MHPGSAAQSKRSRAQVEVCASPEAQAERSEGHRRLRAPRRRLAILARMREASRRTRCAGWRCSRTQCAARDAALLGGALQPQMDDHPRAWIFTSATLAVGEEFGHFTRELGLEQAAVRRWASPFDFARQALLYLPRGLPADPNDPAYTDAVLDAAAPVLEASGGRAFLLFTTLRALRRAHERLRGMQPYPLLVQGTGSRSELLARFRSLGNAVLLGAQSFWEGVDVRGEALSVVVIDKLPFAPPDDPVLAARIEAIARAAAIRSPSCSSRRRC